MRLRAMSVGMLPLVATLRKRHCQHRAAQRAQKGWESQVSCGGVPDAVQRCEELCHEQRCVERKAIVAQCRARSRWAHVRMAQPHQHLVRC